MTYNFSNITFIIPVRFDSLIRLENLSVVFKILSKWKSEIIIVESGKYGNLFIKKMISRLRNVHYFFYQDRDSVFYRTHFINPQFRNPTNSLRSLRSKPPRMRFLLFKLAFCHILTDMSA